MNWYVKRKLQSINKTEATKFLLPMIGNKKHQDRFFINEYFINVYIGDSNKPKYDNHIILKYHYVPSPKFTYFERELIVIKGIKAEYDYDDDRTVMYVFKIPEDLYTDYVKFTQGRYSELSTMYKLQILKFWNLDRDDDNLIMSILFKTNRIINYWKAKKRNPKEFCSANEYWKRPLLDTEVYHHTTIKGLLLTPNSVYQ